MSPRGRTDRRERRCRAGSMPRRSPAVPRSVSSLSPIDAIGNDAPILVAARLPARREPRRNRVAAQEYGAMATWRLSAGHTHLYAGAELRIVETPGAQTGFA